jgi:hypothetical protein
LFGGAQCNGGRHLQQDGVRELLKKVVRSDVIKESKLEKRAT